MIKSFSTSVGIFSVRELGGKEIYKFLNLPSIDFLIYLAKTRKKHIGVYVNDLKLFDTKFYLQEGIC